MINKKDFEKMNKTWESLLLSCISEEFNETGVIGVKIIRKITILF